LPTGAVGGQVTAETWTITLANRVLTVKYKFISIAFSTQIWLVASQFVTIVCPASYLVGISGVMCAGTTTTCAITTTTATANRVTDAVGSSTAVVGADTLGGVITESAFTGSTVSSTMDLSGGYPALIGQVTGELNSAYCNDCKSQFGMFLGDVTVPTPLSCIPNFIPGISATNVTLFLQNFVVSSTANPTITCSLCSLAYFLTISGSTLQIVKMAIAASHAPTISSDFVCVCDEYAASKFVEFDLFVFACTRTRAVPSESVPASCDGGFIFLVSVYQFNTNGQYSTCFVRNLQQAGCLDTDALVAASYHRDCSSCCTYKFLDSIATCTSSARNVCVFEKPSEGLQLYPGSTKSLAPPPIATFSFLPSLGSMLACSASISLTIIPASVAASSIVNKMQHMIFDALVLLKGTTVVTVDESNASQPASTTSVKVIGVLKGTTVVKVTLKISAAVAGWFVLEMLDFSEIDPSHARRRDFTMGSLVTKTASGQMQAVLSFNFNSKIVAGGTLDIADAYAHVRDAYVPSRELNSALEGVAALSLPILIILVFAKVSTDSTTSTRLGIAITDLQSISHYLSVGGSTPAYYDMDIPIGAGTTVTISLSINCSLTRAASPQEGISFVYTDSISDNHVLRMIVFIATPQVVACVGLGSTTGCAILGICNFLKIADAIILLTNTANVDVFYSELGQEAARAQNAADSVSTAPLAAPNTLSAVNAPQNSCSASIIVAGSILTSGSQLTCTSCTIATSDRIAGKASAAATFSFTTTERVAFAAGSSITLMFLRLLTEWCASPFVLFGGVIAACFQIKWRDFPVSTTLFLFHVRQCTIRTPSYPCLEKRIISVIHDQFDDAASRDGHGVYPLHFFIIKVSITIALIARLAIAPRLHPNVQVLDSDSVAQCHFPTSTRVNEHELHHNAECRACLKTASELINACDPRFNDLKHISRNFVSSSKYHLVIWFAVHFAVWYNPMELAFFYRQCLVTIIMTEPLCFARTTIEVSRAFVGCVTRFHLKFAFYILRIVSDSVRVRIAAALNFTFHFSVMSLQIVHRLWRSGLKRMRTIAQTWTSCAVFVGYILTLPLEVQGYGGVRAPQTCELMMQCNTNMWLGHDVACVKRDHGGRDACLM